MKREFIKYMYLQKLRNEALVKAPSNQIPIDIRSVEVWSLKPEFIHAVCTGEVSLHISVAVGVSCQVGTDTSVV